MHLQLFIKFALECAQFGMWRRLNVLDLEMELAQFGMCSVWNTPIPRIACILVPFEIN